ncbi:MAG: ROK family protein [Oscillospiraceae bacterium]|nr:ROK family protein [Oscillospiraceae bacterium]
MYYIGIDIGGTNLKAGLVDEGYQIAATKKMPLKFESMEQMGRTLAEMAVALVEENGISRDQVASVGMGFPGPVDDKNGVVIKTVNIPIRSMPVAEMFHKHWDLPVHLGNDADCAALGEFYHYEDKNIESLILVTLGTGIGTGIILNGKIHTGINGCAGEGGHIVIVHNGEQCTCGRRGCWERYASANALIRQTMAAMDAHPESAMWGLVGGAINRVDGKTAFEAMRKGDAAARAVVNQYLKYLGEGLSNFVNIFQPEVIALGGGVSHERDEDLLVPLQGMVFEQSFGREADRHTKLVKAKLGNDAGIIGAALLGLQ